MDSVCFASARPGRVRSRDDQPPNERLTGLLASVLGSTYGRVPFICCMAGAALLLALANTGLVAGIAAFALAAAGCVAGRALARRSSDDLAGARTRGDAELARVLRLCARSADVWLRHIETVRASGNEHAAELAREFGELCANLDRVIGAQRLAPDQTRNAVLDALERNGHDLQGLVAALHDMQASKRQIVDDIDSHAAALKGNAADIRQIALNIRMVALNATIEAARAGAAGRPFAVIVNDMRDLAARTAEASERFSRETERLHGLVTSALGNETADTTQSIAAAEATVQRVIGTSQATLHELTHAIAAMEGERGAVRDGVSRALVSLQFQDRASQILSHVERSLTDMRERIGEGSWDGVDEGEWLEAMAVDYSTHEEFRNHDGRLAAAGQDGPGVTFF